jgi:hypothetical protein
MPQYSLGYVERISHFDNGDVDQGSLLLMSTPTITTLEFISTKGIGL